MTSKIKVDNINKVSDDSNIIKKCGSTITLGASGDSIALASGASQTGFGRTGTVDWQTGSIKTATFTATSGEGYFCNTAGGSFEVDLPAGSAGAIVSVQDYNNTFDSNALIVDPNGSEKINGGEAGASVTLGTQGQGVTFVYIDATVGWRSVQDNTFDISGTNFISASGGTETTSGDFKIHTFTGPGTFTVTAGGSPGGSDTVSYMVVAGGGSGGPSGNASGGGTGAGAGGAGGFREGLGLNDSYTGSPLRAPTGVPVTAQAYPITVGAGGTAGSPTINPGNSGSISTFSTISSAGGGYGAGGGGGTPGPAANGGSGGGAGGANNPVAGSGNTPPTSPPQGNNGGTGSGGGAYGGGGGGGATAVGANGVPGSGGNGGAGATTSINATPTARAGGGGGGVYDCNSNGSGGTGGGGAGGVNTSVPQLPGAAGSTNTGGGGGGGTSNNTGGYGSGGAGGSGIVIIRYKFQ